MKHEEQHIQEMIAIFKDDFDMHTEEEVHLSQEEHDKCKLEYIIKRMSDCWEIDREYSKQLELKIK